MNQEKIVAAVVQLVVFLFGAFGGFLAGIAPPDSPVGGTPARFAVGLASFVCLLLFLLVRVWVSARTLRARRLWSIAALVLGLVGAGVLVAYQRAYSRSTFVYSFGDTDRRTAIHGGQAYTSEGRGRADTFVKRNHHDPGPGELIRYTGGNLDAVPQLWTAASLHQAHDTLLTRYVLGTVLLTSAIACVVELLFTRRRGATP